MSGMGLLSAPGNEIIVALTISGIDLTVPSNKEYLTAQLGIEVTSLTDYSIRIDMEVRDCVLGEGLKVSGACYECPAGTYLLQAPTVPTECEPCSQEKTFCLGGKSVGPKPGFWRQSALSYNFWPCPAPDQCLGMDISLPFDFEGNSVGLCD